MLHCITMGCWSISMRSEIHGKVSSPVLVALQPHPAESSPWGTGVGSPKQAAHWRFLVFESGTSTCFVPALGASKRHIRQWFILALQLSQRGVQDSWARSPWSNAHQQLAVRAPCPAPSKLPQPHKASRSLQKAILRFAYKQDSALHKIVHFIS